MRMRELTTTTITLDTQPNLSFDSLNTNVFNNDFPNAL